MKAGLQQSTLSGWNIEDAAKSPAPVRSDALWLVSLHSTAGRRWLSCDPPRLEEVEKTLAAIESVSAGFRRCVALREEIARADQRFR